MKKIFSLLTILSLITSYSPLVYAQSASSSGLTATGGEITVNASSSGADSNSPFADNFVDTSITPQNSFSGPDSSSIAPSFDTPAPSAVLGNSQNGRSWTIRQVKNDFRADENYTFNVDNIVPSNIAISVIDPIGNNLPVDYQKFASANGTTIQIVPPKNFRPGKYTLTITDTSGNMTTQDFTWGVLAINTDKSIYLPNETAYLAMAVLDNTGEMVCDASVKLEITNPNQQTAVLSTEDGSIKVNDQCRLHNFSLVPDYEAIYQTSVAGTYNLKLTATTVNGIKSITDSFLVQDSVPFDVQRITATRIYPPATYPVNFNIKVNQDFKGQIIEYVPNSFDITSSTGSASPSFDVKQIASLITNSSGGISQLHLGFPFSGTEVESLGFGQHLLDPKEKDLYSGFGLAGHDGLDFAMPIGTPVLAADDGTVVMAGGIIYGVTVVIQHSWGKSYYGHLSKVEVKLGQTISKGDEIALSGNSGIVTGAHLHFGIKFNQNNPQNGFYGKIDPSPYLGLTSIPVFSSFDNTTKAIVWNVDVKKGDNLNLSYSFRVPPISPEFYTLGPLSFVDNSNVLFQEARVWQLAVDATVVTIITTSYSDPCGSNCYTIPADWSNTNTIEAIGGGGGGGGGTDGVSANNGGRGGGGGGGGGEYRKINNFSSTAGTVIPISVGTGGPGNSGANGTAGNNTTWNTSSLVAVHGNGGGWSNGTGGGTAGAGGTGGTGAAANFNGGAGGVGGTRNANVGGGGAGGGGAGGTTAIGGTAGSVGTSATGTNGGAGGATSGGSVGTQPGGTGGNGTIWTDTSTSATGGAGGGGGGGTGGASGNNGTQGGPGGNYGAGGAGGGGGGRNGTGATGGNGIDGVIVVSYTAISVTTEFGYRWRSDNGNETTGSSLAAEETDLTDLQKNTNVRLRFLIYNSGGSNASGQTFRIDYAALSGTCASSSYAAMPTSAGGPFITATTANYTDGTASTNVSSGPAVINDPSGGTFTAGKLLSTSNQAASITLNSKAFTEIEYNFQATSTATEGQAYCFRVSNAGTAINSYSVYAKATIHVTGPTLDQLLKHGDWFNATGVRQSFTF